MGRNKDYHQDAAVDRICHEDHALDLYPPSAVAATRTCCWARRIDLSGAEIRGADLGDDDGGPPIFLPRHTTAAAYLVLHKPDKKRYVMKKIRLAKQNDKFQRTAYQEMSLMASLSNPYIVEYKDGWVDEAPLSLAQSCSLSLSLCRHPSDLMPHWSVDEPDGAEDRVRPLRHFHINASMKSGFAPFIEMWIHLIQP